MTRLQAVGVLLIALGLIYALLYAAWLRKRRRHGSAAVAVAEPGTEPGKEPAAAEASAVRAEGNVCQHHDRRLAPRAGCRRGSGQPVPGHGDGAARPP